MGLCRHRHGQRSGDRIDGVLAPHAAQIDYLRPPQFRGLGRRPPEQIAAARLGDEGEHQVATGIEVVREDHELAESRLAQHLVGNQAVLLVEEEHAELFALVERHGGPAIVEDRVPRRQQRPLGDGALGEPRGRRRDDLEMQGGGVADAVDLLQEGGGAASTSAKLPKRLINALAMGFTSLRGMAWNSTSSSSS